MKPETNSYIQYGCGTCAPPGWANFDCSPTLKLQRLPLAGRFIRSMCATKFPDVVRVGDIVKGLPLPAASADGVYCSHVLEHLALADFRTALRNTALILKPQGRFRMVLPDLRFIAEEYLRDTSPRAAISFMVETRLGIEHRPKSPLALLRAWLGNSRHLWMWDYESLCAEIVDAGFRNPRRAGFNDSDDARFCDVESPERWRNALGIECVR